MNDLIQDWINDSAGRIGTIDTLMKLSALDLVYVAPLLLLALWFWPAGRSQRALNQRLAVATLFAVLVSLGVAAGLGHLHQEARPFVADASTRLLISHAPDNSFPSDHTALAFALADVVLWRRPVLGAGLLALGVLVGVGRVYVGVHWPDDIVVSALIGLGTGWLFYQLLPLLEAPQRRLSLVLPSALIAAP